MLTEFFKYVQSEWNTLSQAPIVFLLTLVLGASLAWLGLRFRYDGAIATLRERIAAKDDLLSEYRERLHLVPADTKGYSRFSNRELRHKALELVNSIREFLGKCSSEQRRLTDTHRIAMRSASSEEEKSQLWERSTSELINSSLKLNAEYEKRFKVDAIVIRDELLSRLPKDERSNHVHILYEHATNLLGMEEVASDLEGLAKVLP